MQPNKTKLIFRHLIRNARTPAGKLGLIAYFQLSQELQSNLDVLLVSLMLADDYSDQSIEDCIDLQWPLSNYYDALPGYTSTSKCSRSGAGPAITPSAM